LIPIAQVFGWLNLSKDKASNAWFVFAIALGLAGIFFQHFFTRNDVFYLWFPLFWWFIFGLKWRHVSKIASVAT